MIDLLSAAEFWNVLRLTPIVGVASGVAAALFTAAAAVFKKAEGHVDKAPALSDGVDALVVKKLDKQLARTNDYAHMWFTICTILAAVLALASAYLFKTAERSLGLWASVALAAIPIAAIELYRAEKFRRTVRAQLQQLAIDLSNAKNLTQDRFKLTGALNHLRELDKQITNGTPSN